MDVPERAPSTVDLETFIIVWFCLLYLQGSLGLALAESTGKRFFWPQNPMKAAGYLISMQLDKARNILLREKGQYQRPKKKKNNRTFHKKTSAMRKMRILDQSCAPKIVFHVSRGMWPLTFAKWPLRGRNWWKPGSLHCSNPTRRDSCRDL